MSPISTILFLAVSGLGLAVVLIDLAFYEGRPLTRGVVMVRLSAIFSLAVIIVSWFLLFSANPPPAGRTAIPNFISLLMVAVLVLNILRFIRDVWRHFRMNRPVET